MAEGHRIEIDFGPEWERAVKALTAADKDFPKKLDATTKKIAAKAILKARAKAMAIPARGNSDRGRSSPGPWSTRRKLARGVQSRKSNRTGGRRITTSMPAGMEMLPRGFQSQWYHPVFGQGQVIQESNFDWFLGPISNEYDNALRGFHGDMEEIARQIDRMV